MIKNLFTKHERRTFADITKEQAMQAASWYWRFHQFGISFTSPYSLQGAQYYSKLGLRQSINIYAEEDGSNTSVDLSFSGELTDEGAVVGVLGAILVLPVTVAVGAVSYIEYENDAQRLISDFWGYVDKFPKNPKPPAGAPIKPVWAKGQDAKTEASGPQQMLKPCPLCRALLDQDSKFCKYCGTRL